MEGPGRLREQAGGELRRILASSSLDEAPPGAMERTLAAVGGAAATTAAVTTLAKTAAAAHSGGSAVAGTGVLGLAKWAGVGIIAGAVGVGTLQVTGALSPAPPVSGRHAPLVATPPVATSILNPRQPATAERASAAPLEPSAEPPRNAVSAPAPVPDRSGATPSVAPASSSLEAEMADLEQVRRAIAQRRATEALRLLDAFNAQRPRARLSEEASVLRIEALMASGAGSEARQRAAEFLRAHPDSAFSDRIRSLARAPDDSTKSGTQ